MSPVAVVVLINSRGREAALLRLLIELRAYFSAVFAAAGLSYRVVVNVQGAFDPRVNFVGWSELYCNNSELELATMGAVTAAGVAAAASTLREKTGFALSQSQCVILLDDDTTYYPDAATAQNLTAALTRFCGEGHAAYSFKLGQSYELTYHAFVEQAHPFMPHKEKMLWLRPDHLLAGVAHPRFAELARGEDVVLAATAWQSDPRACFAVYGAASLLHLAYEAHLAGETPVAGGLSLLPPAPGPLVLPADIYPDLFVPAGDPRYEFNGVRVERITELLVHGPAHAAFDL